MKEDNKGYSLIELIVTLLVSSVVMLALLGFLVTATKSYRMANAEVTLQIESQIAANQIGELLIQSNKVECGYYPNLDRTADYKVLIITGRDEEGACNFFYIHNEERDELLFAKKSDLEVDTAEVIKECLGSQESLLTRYITEFDVKEVTGNLYQLNMSFYYDGRSFVSSTNVSARN